MHTCACAGTTEFFKVECIQCALILIVECTLKEVLYYHISRNSSVAKIIWKAA